MRRAVPPLIPCVVCGCVVRCCVACWWTCGCIGDMAQGSRGPPALRRLNPIQCDVTSDDDVARAVQEVQQHTYSLWALVNNVRGPPCAVCSAAPCLNHVAGTHTLYAGWHWWRVDAGVHPTQRARQGHGRQLHGFSARRQGVHAHACALRGCSCACAVLESRHWRRRVESGSPTAADSHWALCPTPARVWR